MRRVSVPFLAVLVLLTAFPVSASAGVVIRKIAFDPKGPDSGSNAHLKKEFVLVKNTGSSRRSLRDWKLQDRGRDHVYRFPALVLRPGEYVRIRTGRGQDGGVTGCNGSCFSYYDFYWGLQEYVWNNRGDVATLKNRSGAVVDRCRYGRGATSPKRC